jgi:hypothetical protein
LQPSWWIQRRTNERVVLAVAAAALVLALVLAALVVIQTPTPPLSVTVVVPSASPTESADLPAASAGGSPVAPGDRNSPADEPAPAAVAGSVWALPTGWRYALECDSESSCFLSLYDAADKEQDGWPVAIRGNCDGSVVAVGPKDSAFLECTRGGDAVVIGLDRTGNPLPGWPVTLKGEAAWSTWNDFTFVAARPFVAVGPDATVYVAARPSGARSYVIHALGPDGHARTGWPVPLAGDLHGFAVARDGVVVAWWYEGYQGEEIQINARRTVYTQIGLDGTVLAGWPRGSSGAASGPIVSDDGSMFYVSATGKVWGHDRRGEIIDGWPYQLAYPVAPAFRPDGALIFLEHSRIVVVDGHGRSVGHWPYRIHGTLMAQSCDTPSFPEPLDAVAPDGTLYIASSDDDARSSVVALRPDGSTVDGWPYIVPDGWRVTDLAREADGTVRASVAGNGCEFRDGNSFRLTSHGSLVGDPLPTPLSKVYQAMRLEGLRTTSGKDIFDPGAQIDFEVALSNRSSGLVTLPHVDYDDPSGYAAGSIQTWIEPLVPLISYSGPPYPCLAPFPRPDSDWYTTGGRLLISSDPVTIEPGASIAVIETTLSPETTGCLSAGEYRYRVEYKQLDASEDEEAIDEATFVLTIVAPAPVVTPTPSPPPPPTPAPSPFPTS